MAKRQHKKPVEWFSLNQLADALDVDYRVLSALLEAGKIVVPRERPTDKPGGFVLEWNLEDVELIRNIIANMSRFVTGYKVSDHEKPSREK